MGRVKMYVHGVCGSSDVAYTRVKYGEDYIQYYKDWVGNLFLTNLMNTAVYAKVCVSVRYDDLENVEDVVIRLRPKAVVAIPKSIRFNKESLEYLGESAVQKYLNILCNKCADGREPLSLDELVPVYTYIVVNGYADLSTGETSIRVCKMSGELTSYETTHEVVTLHDRKGSISSTVYLPLDSSEKVINDYKQSVKADMINTLKKESARILRVYETCMDSLREWY